jgi:hypothetical protein
MERGLTYNPNWGQTDNEVAYMGNPFPKIGNEGQFNDRVNYFHKPQINLTHFWSIGERLTASTVAYLSIGRGGGTAFKNESSVGRILETGQLDVQTVYNSNSQALPSSLYHPTERPASTYLRSSNNNHIWYGILSTWNYKISKSLSAMAGLDGRYYKGSHFQTVYDLMGADYAIDNSSNANQANGTFPGDPKLQNAIRRVGDTISYFNDAFVKWAGGFTQLEFKKNKWTAFFTSSISQTS